MHEIMSFYYVIDIYENAFCLVCINMKEPLVEGLLTHPW